jgi:putative flippase GtrA
MTIALPRQFARFVAVGVVNTGLFLVVYLGFRLVASAGVATVLATLLTTVTGTSANGRVTFGGPVGMRHHVKSLAVTVLGMVITSAAVDTFGAGDSRLGELVVLVVASTAAGAVRFALLRYWVFGSLLVLAPPAEELEAGDAEDGLPNVLRDVQQFVDVGSDAVEGGQDRQHVLVEMCGQAR